MAVQNQVELLLALGDGGYDLVLGTAEAEDIDFKEAPYQLDVPRQKWELAKDVAALANSRGGVVVIGFRTERAQNHLVDTATEHRPVPKGLVNWDSYRQTIGRWVHPAVAGLAGRWFPADPGVDRGVFALIVPPQAENLKYFVVAEMLRDDRSFPGALGVPVRHGDAVDWLRPESVHSLLREALWWRQRGPARQEPPVPEATIRAVEQRLSQRCQEIEAAAGWADTPFLALHAIPNPSWARPDDFYSEAGLRGRLAAPGVLRQDGFHIRTWADAEVTPDGSLRSATNRKVLWLSPDGLLSAGASADGEFLGWYFNQKRAPTDPIALNPRVTAEYVLEFCRFVHAELKPRSQATFDLWLSIVGFDRQGGVLLVPALSAGGNLGLFWRGMFREERQPIRPRADIRVPSGASNGGDAYRLMVELYALFAEAPDSIPYVVNGEISADAIMAGVLA